MTDPCPSHSGHAPALPGLSLATQLLTTQRDTLDDAVLLMQEFDPDQAQQMAEAPAITPDLALDALMILRLCAAHARAGHPSMHPDGGKVTLICTAQPAQSKRLKGLFHRLNAKMLGAMGVDATGLHPLQLERVQLVRHVGAEASRIDTACVIKQIEDAVLRGDPVIVFTSGTQPLGAEVQGSVDVSLTLPPTDAAMLAALLGILHRTEIAEAALPASGIAALGDLQLSRVLAAETEAEALAQLQRLCAPADHISLDQVHGQPEAQAAFQQLVADMGDWRAARLDWSEVTSSFLLVGPPGTGKTHLANALAGSAGLPFIKTSYSDCQKAGHQGDMLRELHAAAGRAMAQAPAIFFLDEIDSFHARGKPFSNGYILGVVNGLLTLLDQLNATDGIVVIAATNHVDMIDPAVIRAGRFDCHIPVGPLDRASIRAMLRAELAGDILSDTACNHLADQLSGRTGADIASLLRAARTRARRAKLDLTAQHVRDAADQIAPRPDADLQRRIAIHEAGHILVGHLFGMPTPYHAEVNARTGMVTASSFDFLTAGRISSLIRGDLGGHAAEQVVFGTACDGSGGDSASDLARATHRAVKAELSFGFGETLSWQNASSDLQRLSPRQRSRVEQQLQQAIADAREALQTHRADLERITDTLLRERTLKRDQIAALLRDVPVFVRQRQPQPDSTRDGASRARHSGDTTTR